MGMSTLSSHVIMFIAVLSISTLVVAVFNSNMDETASSISSQQNWMSKQIKTDITIEVIDYIDRSENQTYVYLENTGSTILDLSYIDVFVGGKRIDRNEQNRKISVLEDTEINNPGRWDPKEELEIIINETLQANETYDLVVTGQYNSKAVDRFST